MIIIRILIWWGFIGTVGWFIGTLSDTMFQKNKEITNPLWSILLGPISFYFSIRSVFYGMWYAMNEERKEK